MALALITRRLRTERIIHQRGEQALGELPSRQGCFSCSVFSFPCAYVVTDQCKRCGGECQSASGEVPMRQDLRTISVVVSILLAILGSSPNLAAVDFAATKSYAVGTSPAAIVVGDFNGDGKVDIAVANTGSSDVSILLGNGDGTFQPAVNFSAGNSPSAIAVGDFNGDGKLDLAVLQPGANGVAGSVGILLGNGDGTFQAPKTLSLSVTALFLAVADFNLDKKSDLAVGDSAGLNVFIGNGDGTFQPAKQTALSSN